MARWREWARRWLPLLLWMVAIYVMSDQPSDDIPVFGWLDWLFKKSAHFIAYAILALLARRALTGMKLALWGALAISIAYAISDEWHQTMVPGRNGQLPDVIIDTLGAVSMLLALGWGRGRQRWARES